MLRERAGRLAGEIRETPAFVPGLLALAVVVVWSKLDGGYEATRWLPGTLFVLALLTVVIVAVPGRVVPASRAIVVALVAFAAFTVWCYLSISWAGVEGISWDGANRTLLYFSLFALFALRPWRASTAALLLGGYSLAIAAIGLYELLRTARADDPVDSFIVGRLAAPIAYPNAACALFLMAIWPAVFLSSRRETPIVARAALFAAAGVLAELALVCQSRASLISVPAAVLLYLLLLPGRLRALLVLVPTTIVVAVSARPLLDVYSAVVDDVGVHDAVVHARDVLLVGAAILGVYGLVVAIVDSRIEVPSRVSFAISRVVAIVAVIAFTVTAAVLALKSDYSSDRAAAAWDRFKENKYVSESGTPHFASGVGSGRYDLWRVALDEFKEKPITGVGVDNYAVDYLRHRHIQGDPLYPHSIALRVPAQTGIVGTVLIVVFLGAAVTAAALRMLRGPAFARGVAGAAFMVFVYWFVHGLVDWFWEIPALGAAAFSFLGLAVRTGDPAEESATGRATLLARVAVVPIAFAAAASIVLPWLSAQESSVAASSWGANPQKAFDRLDRARRLNPLTDYPDVIAGIIAGRLRNDRLQKAAFLRALDRNPTNWYPMVQLAALEDRDGNKRKAYAWLRRVEQLNPLEASVPELRLKFQDGKKVSSVQLERLFVNRAEFFTGARQK
jgi:O-Antigen ligase